MALYKSKPTRGFKPMSYQDAYNNFKANQDDVEAAILQSTRQGFAGSNNRAKLELFKDGTYRVLPSVGNLYNSDGLIVIIPELREDEYDTEGDEHFYDNAIDLLDIWVESAIDESAL